MDFLTGYHTDIGIRKKTNQDALLIKTADTHIGKVGLFVICDGMGGLSQGELVSSIVVVGFSKWFEEELPNLIKRRNIFQEIQNSVEQYIRLINSKIINHGRNTNQRLGTTLTAMIIIDEKYFVFHIGDSRLYKLDNQLDKITKDQSLVAREIELGRLTEEEAKVHPGRNVLLQCVGVTPTINIAKYAGKVENNTVYLLCTDGFYHEIENEELLNRFNPSTLENEDIIKSQCIELVELAKSRMETDNISVLVVKTI